MNVLPYGEHALLVEMDDPRAVPMVRARLAGVTGVVDAIAGACTVLVDHEPGAAEAVLAALDRGDFAAAEGGKTPRSVELTVVYDGADLEDVAAVAHCTVDELVALHCAAEYVVRFCGFAPGFAYLDGLDARLQVARRAEPRTAVPAGSVAIAGGFCGVYPRSSPGGWQLLGHTDALLWDADRDPPALLVPGTAVTFRPS